MEDRLTLREVLSYMDKSGNPYAGTLLLAVSTPRNEALRRAGLAGNDLATAVDPVGAAQVQRLLEKVGTDLEEAGETTMAIYNYLTDLLAGALAQGFCAGVLHCKEHNGDN